MNLALVNPPKTAFDLEELAPPLGLLKLAAIAFQLGATVSVEDFNLLWHLDEELRASFYERAVSRLLALDADVYAFTSMAVDSHVALELGRRIKLAQPAARIWVGGAHFSSIATFIDERFPWVDKVFRGEAEAAFANALRDHFGLDGHLPEGSDGTISPLYDAVPLPAYFHLNPRRVVDLEAGRGCRFKCAFCYSPGHYAPPRDFGPDAVLKELLAASAIGARHAWFVEDNFLNFPDRARRLCGALAEAKLGMTWSCYATFPQLTPPMILAMARAGCTEVFTGVDAIGHAAQRAFRKAFVKSDAMLQRTISLLNDSGIRPTCAFLLCPPSLPGGENFEETVWAAVGAQAAGAQVLLNPLTLYPGTPAWGTSRNRATADDALAKIMIDVPEIVSTNPLARESPDMFPFHSRYVAEEEWRSFLAVSHCLLTLVWSYPRTLEALRDQDGISAAGLARRVLGGIDDWSEIPNYERRPHEVQVGRAVIEEMTAGTRAGRIFDRELEEEPAPMPAALTNDRPPILRCDHSRGVNYGHT